MILVFDMAAVSEMGEIDDVHSKDEDETVLNGDIADIDDDDEDDDNNSESSLDTNEKSQPITTDDDNKDNYEKCNEQMPMDVDNEDDSEISKTDDNEDNAEDKKINDCSNNKTNKQNDISSNNKEEVHEIIDDDDDEDVDDECDDSEDDDGVDHNEGDDEHEDETTTVSNNHKNGINKNSDEPIELNDSGGDDGDVMIIEETKENGGSVNNNNNNNKRRHSSDELEVIELDTTPPVVKKKIDTKQLPTRRSIRNINKQKSYVENERDMSTPQTSEESDIEEILPQDPLAVSNDKIEITRRSINNKNSNNTTITQQTTTTTTNSSSTIVVKDTKRLVEIAAKSSNNSHSGNKKEPTLVIIDTNSILSGRGPVPIGKNQNQSQIQSYPTILPTALPAQGMYPPNMRATITPIPMISSSSSVSISSTSIKQHTAVNTSSSSSLAPVLPTLTDDMFVVEAPSFIVPYVYEKPPVTDFKDFLKDFENNLKMEQNKDDKDSKSDDDNNKNDNKTSKSVSDDDEFMKIDDDSSDDKKPYSYFESPLGKFFIDIGFNLVQEYVQSDLLKQQKRKRDREGGHNPTTNKTINSLMKNLEFSKEHNEPFKIPFKRCEFCNFKSESFLAMAHHLETPHTKNYVYKCNFCTYEVRNPHDILFHMEAEHATRGRLERAPAFHQCPNCPFEDNQKGKLSRHLATCMKKFKPEKNLEPPLDWEPPAKIPRVPKQRQGLNVSAYQAMKTSQLQFLSKMQLLNSQNTQQHPLHRGRGRPSLGTNIKGQPQSSQQQQQQLMRPSNMVYKQQTMSGGSVLVPTNYQLSGNQVFQQQNQSKNKSMHQPSISITPLPRASSTTTSNTNMSSSKPGDTNSKNSFVICEICDGYIKDLEQLRNHMQWIHKVKIHPKMIYNRPPLNCQKCQFRFFTDQGLERHLLGSHGLVTSSMQDAANKSKDAGRCPVCGRVYQWKLLNHVARDHNMTLKPAHLSYKCTVCTATFGMYKQFENHVYSAHSVVARRVMDKKNSSSSTSSSSSLNNNSSSKNDQLMKPLKINDEITIIPQPAKSITSAGTSKESSPTGSTNSRNYNPSTSKNADATTLNSSTISLSTTTSNS